LGVRARKIVWKRYWREYVVRYCLYGLGSFVDVEKSHYKSVTGTDFCLTDSFYLTTSMTGGSVGMGGFIIIWLVPMPIYWPERCASESAMLMMPLAARRFLM
jgi:hypothetical protein